MHFWMLPLERDLDGPIVIAGICGTEGHERADGAASIEALGCQCSAVQSKNNRLQLAVQNALPLVGLQEVSVTPHINST